MLSNSEREHQVDKKFDADVENEKITNKLFIRLIASNRKFTKVDFKYSIFDTCYLRNCKFISCDFTGCRFIGTNLHGAKFSSCEFQYATFEKTLIDNHILDQECPEEENLKMRFARSLRMNYQSLGDAESANKAMSVELKATEEHLYKSWNSNSSYYRNKYKGWNRVQEFSKWSRFKLLDFIWGNGESPWKLLRVVLILFAFMALIDVIAFSSSQSINSYVQSFLNSPQIFLGTFTPANYSSLYLTLIVLIRLIAFGFFMSIIIKQLNRR
ncbi:MAG: pentapeptide repeat-containing protein [Oscillatoriophycideae cyanobacterium NC_groundwater_1537_Pr4_S-0.65um_50_18]|nr:pentapeptide repeat-containing protein [Oscillatoriophycideae cyanobacterium NC_groundwater_1537_Pr4_S-0.65um_50_18]